LLSKKYGAPVSDKANWSQDLYRDNPKQWGRAVGAGHLILATAWGTPKTSIRLVCSGENFKIAVRVFYVSKELDALRRKSNQTKALDGL
jgi:hypothetical protein